MTFVAVENINHLNNDNDNNLRFKILDIIELTGDRFLAGVAPFAEQFSKAVGTVWLIIS